MKKSLAFITMMLFGAIIIMHVGCEMEPQETCQQDKFCDGTVSVTACCTNGEDCYYT